MFTHKIIYVHLYYNSCLPILSLFTYIYSIIDFHVYDYLFPVSWGWCPSRLSLMPKHIMIYIHLYYFVYSSIIYIGILLLSSISIYDICWVDLLIFIGEVMKNSSYSWPFRIWYAIIYFCIFVNYAFVFISFLLLLVLIVFSSCCERQSAITSRSNLSAPFQTWLISISEYNLSFFVFLMMCTWKVTKAWISPSFYFCFR
jgi:hypothetical protein